MMADGFGMGFGGSFMWLFWILLILVLRQDCIDGFSWSVSIHGKARLAANGHREGSIPFTCPIN